MKPRKKSIPRTVWAVVDRGHPSGGAMQLSDIADTRREAIEMAQDDLERGYTHVYGADTLSVIRLRVEFATEIKIKRETTR